MRTICALVLLGVGGCAASTSSPPAPAPAAPAKPAARRAPDFTLTDSDGQPVTLSKLLAEGPVILAFFPKAFTGG